MEAITCNLTKLKTLNAFSNRQATQGLSLLGRLPDLAKLYAGIHKFIQLRLGWSTVLLLFWPSNYKNWRTWVLVLRKLNEGFSGRSDECVRQVREAVKAGTATWYWFGCIELSLRTVQHWSSYWFVTIIIHTQILDSQPRREWRMSWEEFICFELIRKERAAAYLLYHWWFPNVDTVDSADLYCV